MQTATALAHPNIAFIKYWGNRDHDLRLPANPSLSMNLDGLHSKTQVQFSPEFQQDSLTLNGNQQTGPALLRLVQFLDHVRRLAGFDLHANVTSENNFPTGTGIASSASAFAALSLAASRAAGLDLDQAALSRLARLGSGSAARSVPGGFVQMQTGDIDREAYAFPIAPPEHWHLVDCICVVSEEHKATGSSTGHQLADTSVLQPARIADAARRLEVCKQALIKRDFEQFAAITELDSNMMHAVMQTSQPVLMYWQPATVQIMQSVLEWRRTGLPVCYTIDAGPNVHVLTPAENVAKTVRRLKAIPGIRDILQASPGGPAKLL